MRTLIILLGLAMTTLFTACQAQVRNAKTATVTISGNCGMCKKTIEQAALVKGVAMADWNKDTQRATITYDSTRTDADAILKRIAHAGYDNERYLTTDAAHAALHGCCRYERTLKKAPLAMATAQEDEQQHTTHAEAAQPPAGTDPLAALFDAYFGLKDALVASDAVKARTAAQGLEAAAKAVDMGALGPKVHAVWMEVMDPIANIANTMGKAKGLEAQRKAFMGLTASMTRLAKATPVTAPIYLDHCPMYEGGADWLSRDKAIRNPFYGTQMMTCGSVKETITQ